MRWYLETSPYTSPKVGFRQFNYHKYMTRNNIALNNVSRFLIGTSLMMVTLVVLGVPALTYAATFNRQMEMGMTGPDISTLQSFLAQDPTLYPQGLVTGYFGSFTKTAVSNFQSRNDIPAVGRVGPITLTVLNAQYTGGVTSGSTIAPIITSVNVNANNSSATLNWTTNESTKGVVYYSTSPLTIYENLHSVTVSGNTAMTDTLLRTSQNLSLSNLQTNTTYYYLIHTTDQDGNVSITWPSTFKTTTN